MINMKIQFGRKLNWWFSHLCIRYQLLIFYRSYASVHWIWISSIQVQTKFSSSLNKVYTQRIKKKNVIAGYSIISNTMSYHTWIYLHKEFKWLFFISIIRFISQYQSINSSSTCASTKSITQQLELLHILDNVL